MNRTQKQLFCLAALGMACAMSGCHKALFPKNQQKNQFEAYNTMRYGPQIVEQKDPFGLPEPALRARLGKKE